MGTGGYERFSAEYPFLRTQKIMYTPMVRIIVIPTTSLYLSLSLFLSQELQNLPCFPSEILPLFLYLGDHRHAYNASLNYDLKLHNHIRLGNDQELPPAFPESTNELHIDVEDTPEADLASRFEEIVEFIGKRTYSEWSHPLHKLHCVCLCRDPSQEV